MASGDRPHAKPGIRQVVASVDRTGAHPRLVIAERGRDGASLSAVLSSARSLREWR
jgi:hypothetical protein